MLKKYRFGAFYLLVEGVLFGELMKSVNGRNIQIFLK